MDKRFDKFAGTYNIEWNQYDTSISDKKIYSQLYFAKFCILPLLLNTVFIHHKVIEHLCSYLATFLITAAIKVVFLKTVQLVTVDVTYKSVIYSLER